MSSSSKDFAGRVAPRVVVGVDGSVDGMRAVRYGARAAAALDAELHLVHVVDDAVLAGSWGVVYDPGVLQEAGRQATEQARAEARAAGLADDRVREEVVLGNPVGVLGRLCEGAALLVTGRRSVSGLERMFIGSTSVSLAQAAPCPVVVISAASTPEVTGAQQRIAVGVDAGPHAAATVEWALAEARRRGAALSVVHVIPAGQQAHGSDELVEAAGRGVHELVAPLVAAHPQVAVDVQVLTGNPVDALVGLTEEVDLLVLGVPRSRLLGIHLGGVMRGVLAHAACPVAVVTQQPSWGWPLVLQAGERLPTTGAVGGAEPVRRLGADGGVNYCERSVGDGAELSVLVEAGELELVVDSRSTLDEYAAAFERLESRRAKGKVAITL